MDSAGSGATRPANAYVRGGGFLVIFHCKNAHEWIDVVDLTWRPVDTKDWLWWTKPNPYIEIRQPEPKHPLCKVIPVADMGWHWFGAFDLHPAAQSVLNLDDDSGSLFLDFRALEGGGRLMISTLDPHVHNGERFMPACRRFLQAFPWLNRELGIERDKPGFVVTYLQCFEDSMEWAPEGLAEAFAQVGGTLALCPQYQLNADRLASTDILYIPHIHDQFFLRDIQPQLLDFLARGGHMVICSEPHPWLPFLGAFRRCRAPSAQVRAQRSLLLRNMDAEFDGWRGIFANMPAAGQDAERWLTDVGSQEDQAGRLAVAIPDRQRKGGMVFMPGDNMVRYPTTARKALPGARHRRGWSTTAAR